jgi:hypothetical protein
MPMTAQGDDGAGSPRVGWPFLFQENNICKNVGNNIPALLSL